MANVFSVASKAICKMINVIDRISEMALNITDVGVEAYRVISAKLEMTKQKMDKLKSEGKSLTRDNLDSIEL